MNVTPDRGRAAAPTASRRRKQIHLAAQFPSADHHTVWSDPEPGGHVGFDSFAHLARTAERGRFDCLLVAEGGRVPEHRGRFLETGVVGGPDAITVLAALAAVTQRIGLAADATATYNEPYELARRLASLDHLSAGRAAWNVVTSTDASTGENFRRGGFLSHAQRYERAAEFVGIARAVWDAWEPEAVRGDQEAGVFAAPEDIGRFTHEGRFFCVEGQSTVPRAPQGHPVLIQDGFSDEGREFGAAYADIVRTRHRPLDHGRAVYADIKGRVARHGRRSDDVKVMPGVGVVLADTDAEARELAEHLKRRQIGPRDALRLLERVWGRDLSGLDPDGPLPDFDPDTDGAADITRGRGRPSRDAIAVAAEWRALAEEKGLGVRESAIEVFVRPAFVGSPATVARDLESHVQQDACDGFILIPTVTPTGLDAFVDRVVPLLQERGSFRADYTGTTLRDHLGLGVPGRRVADGERGVRAG